jgi:hypothetical protein
MDPEEHLIEELPDFGTKLLQEAEQILLGFQTNPLVSSTKLRGVGSSAKTREQIEEDMLKQLLDI